MLNALANSYLDFGLFYVAVVIIALIAAAAIPLRWQDRAVQPPLPLNLIGAVLSFIALGLGGWMARHDHRVLQDDSLQAWALMAVAFVSLAAWSSVLLSRLFLLLPHLRARAAVTQR